MTGNYIRDPYCYLPSITIAIVTNYCCTYLQRDFEQWTALNAYLGISSKYVLDKFP